MLYDTTTRAIVARDRIELLRRDFREPGGSLRAAVGRRLARRGARLAGREAGLVSVRAGLRRPVASRPSSPV